MCSFNVHLFSDAYNVNTRLRTLSVCVECGWVICVVLVSCVECVCDCASEVRAVVLSSPVWGVGLRAVWEPRECVDQCSRNEVTTVILLHFGGCVPPK